MKKGKEYIHKWTKKDDEIIDLFYELMEEYDYHLVNYESHEEYKTIIKKLKHFISEAPNFYDPHLELYSLLKNEGKIKQAVDLLEETYEIVLKTITDKKGNWPVLLEWGWLENRSLIRTMLAKADDLWKIGETEKAKELYLKILKANPRDNPGIRYYLLATLEGISAESYDKKFPEYHPDFGQVYKEELYKWFDIKARKHPEFKWWFEYIEKKELEEDKDE